MPSQAMSDSNSAPPPPSPALPVAVQTLLFGAFRQVLLPLLRRRYGDVLHVRLYPGRNFVQLMNFDHIKTVFNGPATVFHAGEGNEILKPILGERSVFTTDEDDHRRIRGLLTPTFHGAALRGYRELTAELAGREVRRWPTGRVFGAHQRMRVLSLEIIIRVVWGVGEGPRLDELRRRLPALFAVNVIDLFGWHNEKLRRYGPWRRAFQNQRRVEELIYAEIADRRRAHDLAGRSDMLSRLLAVPAEEDRLTDAELRDQLVTLLVAGYETTATALAWSLHELARDPVRLDRALAAVDTGDEKYLEAVVQEAMRLHPVVPQVGRKLTRDIDVGGYRIPAGYVVIPSILMVHTDAAQHRDPARFRPERFLNGEPSGAWFPFGGGVRRCLGAGFALLEATIVLREILSRYRLLPDRWRPESHRFQHVTLVPSRGARISVIAHDRE